MTPVLATYSIKGGVGKTTTAVNLAYLCAAAGARTLVWDLDPQGGASFLFRVRPRVKGGSRKLVRGRSPVERSIKGTDYDGLDLLPADLSYRHMDLHLDATKRRTQRLSRVLAPLVDEYDCIILDCPPSLSLVSENVFDAASLVLVPMVPSPLPTRTLDQVRALVGTGRRRPDVLAFFSMVDKRRKLHNEVIAEHVGKPGVLKTTIPAAAIFERMGTRRAPIGAFVSARHPAAVAYRDLWEEIGVLH